MALPPQEELRRRLRAARILADKTITELAARLPAEAELGERTLRKLESGESNLKPQLLRELANALEFPYEWFTVDDIRACLTDDRVDARLVQLERNFTARLAALEERMSSGRVDDDGHPRSGDPQPTRARRAPRSSRPGRGQ